MVPRVWHVRPARFVRIACSRCARTDNPERLSNRDNFHSTDGPQKIACENKFCAGEKSKAPVDEKNPPVTFQNPRVDFKKPPTVFSKPPVARPDPPVKIQKPPVDFSRPPVLFGKPPVEIPNSAVVFRKAPVSFPKPPVENEKPRVVFEKPPTYWEKMTADFPKTGGFCPFSRLNGKCGGQKSTFRQAALPHRHGRNGRVQPGSAVRRGLFVEPTICLGQAPQERHIGRPLLTELKSKCWPRERQRFRPSWG